MRLSWVHESQIQRLKPEITPCFDSREFNPPSSTLQSCSSSSSSSSSRSSRAGESSCGGSFVRGCLSAQTDFGQQRSKIEPEDDDEDDCTEPERPSPLDTNCAPNNPCALSCADIIQKLCGNLGQPWPGSLPFHRGNPIEEILVDRDQELGFWCEFRNPAKMNIVAIYNNRQTVIQHCRYRGAFSNQRERRGGNTKVHGRKETGDILERLFAQPTKLDLWLVSSTQIRPD